MNQPCKTQGQAGRQIDEPNIQYTGAGRQAGRQAGSQADRQIDEPTMQDTGAGR